MANVEQYLLDEGYEKFKEAYRLSDIESKNDPEEEPYRSKYKSREILKQLHEKISDLRDENESKDDLEKTKIRLGLLEYLIGVNYLDTEEMSSGEEHIKKCMDLLESHKLDIKACNLVQNAYNQLGILWTTRRQPDTALSYLQRSEDLYKQFKQEVGNAPWKLSELFQPERTKDVEKLDKEREANFESTYTHTLYYLAQVYAKVDQTEKAAVYCHDTLRRQLDTDQFDPLDWMLNAATLSQYYITQGEFRYARHCLASANFMLSEVMSTPPEDEAEREKVDKAKADLERCWSKYCLALMELSRERLMDEVGDMDEELRRTRVEEETKEETDGKNEREEMRGKKEGNTVGTGDHNQDQADGATNLNGNDIGNKDKTKIDLKFNLEVTKYEELVTDQYLLIFSDAREVFLKAQSWLNSAKELYSLDDWCSDYVEIIQDQSKLFKVLAFFEPDFERQCKMHKRRIDMLSDVLKELNPQFYLLVCRQLMYELAETYSSMLDLKLAIIEASGDPPTQHAVKKVNQLIRQSLEKYNAYIDSLRDPKKQLPDKFAEDDVRPALIAKFCTGRLYSKLIDPDPVERLRNMSSSLECYKFIVDYCKRNPEAVEKVKSEHGLCVEMATLLPAKMERLRESTAEL
ncbi:KIF1-binding protein homolog [Lingula anatina]|uniref:KIF-binding protein n=1 Tax=Lingula anatina TaxID=7574 RepID=A0A1S3IDL7_LINAN|nr:KIF1-binding protein homolog [Lingula anatina]|eukprot:XP_013396332.1 KIF1-binding protein homolog [Lingula anatina]